MNQRAVPRAEWTNGPDREGKESNRQADDLSDLLRLLDERLRFETMLSRLSTTFINLPADEVDSQIERGLQQIVDFLGIERSSLAQFSEDRSELVVTHSYTIPGFDPFPRVNVAPLVPWYTEMARQGRVLRFTRLPDELPPDAGKDRDWYLRNKNVAPVSHLLIPFKVGEAILGGLAFGTLRGQRDWPDDLVQSLQLVGEIFANALARKRAEESLRTNEARLRLLLESTKAIPWVADAQTWRFIYVGPQAGPLLGFPLAAWYEEDFWADHLHPEDREAALAFCLEHSRGHADYEFDYRMVAADGHAVWLHDVVNVISENGVPKTLRGFLIDATARRQAEAESQSLREQLVRAGRITLMGELAASIAHEVNQPLCAITANAQAILRMIGGRDIEEVREALQDVIQDGERASAVIARIRGLFQKGTPERVRVDVNHLIGEMVAVSRREMAGRGVVVKTELAERLPGVLGDRVQLQQVILNLLANGTDAMDKVARELRTLVIRSTADEAGTVAVAVQDAGVGLDPRTIDQVFDPFYTTKPGSMGMGLAICHSIIEAHGGRIWARRNADRGTTFLFALPGIKERTS